MSSNQNRINVNNLLSSLENEFTTFVYDYTSPYYNNPLGNTRPSRSRQRHRNNYSIPQPSTSSPGEQINMNILLQQYNENIHMYQRNIQNYTFTMDNILCSLQNPIANPNRGEQPEQNRNHSVPTNTNANADTVYNRRTVRRNPRDNIVLTYLSTLPLHRTQQRLLTNRQIELSTQNIVYNAQMQENRCPISWENFQVGEEVCQIKQCGHIFNKASLMNWFSRNTVCPVCRYDITTYREVYPQNSNHETPSNNRANRNIQNAVTSREGQREGEVERERQREGEGEVEVEGEVEGEGEGQREGEREREEEPLNDIFERLMQNLNDNLYEFDVTFERTL
jgi:hypothetical protein